MREASVQLDPQKPGRPGSGVLPLGRDIPVQVDHLAAPEGIGRVLHLEVQLPIQEISQFFPLVDEEVRRETPPRRDFEKVGFALGLQIQRCQELGLDTPPGSGRFQTAP